jgi:LPS-assembly protein
VRKLIILVTIIVFNYSSTALAELSSKQCGFTNEGFLPVVANPEQATIDVKADTAQSVKNEATVFTGDVEVSHGGQELKSDRATYNRLSGEITAQGNVEMRDSEVIVKSKRAEWSVVDDEGSMTDASYLLRQGHARGQAEKVLRQGKVQTDLDEATYTTCAEGNEAWVLKASHVNLDHVKQAGTARNVVIKLADIPVFYTPYISFPLSKQRKSGFLTPSIGNTEATGFDLRTPYYWNIAPEMDATITPRYMSERGLMLNGQFRYLNNKYDGTIDAGILASDDLQQEGEHLNPYFNEDRKHFSWQHKSKFTSHLHTNVDYNYVSDNAYLEDFGSNLSLTSTTHLNRLLNVRYNSDNWNLSGRLQGYQTVKNVRQPYQKLPQLRFQGALPDQATGLSYAMTAEYVDFYHDDLVTAQRFDIAPSISYPLRSAAGFVRPRIALHHTRYELDANGTSIVNASPTRTLPVSSIDSGLFFERDMTISNNSFIQTLEPRLFYLYIPERHQDDIPIFDSGLNTFSMGQLFSHNRFAGSDRVGDTNQLSVALTTRIINQQTGREKFHATLGQIQYFSDRKVTLKNAPAETQSDSDMVAEVVASITDEWTARGEIQWDPHADSNKLSAMSITYRGREGQLLNLSHRYRRDNLEQIDISARIPFNKQWSMVGRWYHSLHDNRTLETLAGLEYDSCCWATRIVGRDYINSSTDQERNLAIFFQIELKGLGNFGQESDSLLEKSILGFGL